MPRLFWVRVFLGMRCLSMGSWLELVVGSLASGNSEEVQLPTVKGREQQFAGRHRFSRHLLLPPAA